MACARRSGGHAPIASIRGPRVSIDVISANNTVAAPPKFAYPDFTAKGEPRANVPLDSLETLWINTGTLCNITCQNCYIESSPSNDRLEYIKTAEVAAYLDEIADQKLGTTPLLVTAGNL